VLKHKTVAPHSSEPLMVVMDTSMKQGVVKKDITVKSNDPKNPVSTIYVTAEVKNPHADMGKDVQAKIFQGRCAACHVNDGIGKQGEVLYLADCSMCHGFRGGGAVAPALTHMDYGNREIVDAMRKIISEGSTIHRSMPGFSKRKGGPLSDEDIESLLQYLAWRSKQEKQK